MVRHPFGALDISGGVNIDVEALGLRLAEATELGEGHEQLVPGRGHDEAADAVRRKAVLLPEQRHVFEDLEQGLAGGLVGSLQLDDDQIAESVPGQNVDKALCADIVRQLVVDLYESEPRFELLQLLGQLVTDDVFFRHRGCPDGDCSAL